MLLLHWHDPQLKFLIKHNFRREDRYALADKLKSVCQNVKHPREGKTVYIGSTWRDFETEKDGKFAIRMVYEITERTTDATGQEMLFPETEIDMYWTSLGVSDEEAIELYHKGVEQGCVIQTTYSQDSEIFCCCGVRRRGFWRASGTGSRRKRNFSLSVIRSRM